MKRALTVIIVALFSSSLGFSLGPPSVNANQNGLKKYNQEDYVGAFKDFANALGRDSRNPSFHFNLGDAFLKNGEVGKALSEYESVEKNPAASSDLKFDSMFNAGNAAVQAKDIPKALSYYQKALDYRPDSREVKTNIELALKQQQGGGGNGNDKQQQDKGSEKKDNKDNKDKKDQKDQKDPKDKQDQSQPEPKSQPKPFQSQALNENDVRRILEELKRQEEQIRAKQNVDNRKTPEKQIDKDW